MAWQVRITLASGEIQRRRITSFPAIVGRNAGLAFSIDDASLAGRHFSFGQEPGGELYVMDLETGSGTLLNGRRVARAPVRENDRVQAGNVVFVWEGEKADVRFQEESPSRRMDFLKAVAFAGRKAAEPAAPAAPRGDAPHAVSPHAAAPSPGTQRSLLLKRLSGENGDSQAGLRKRIEHLASLSAALCDVDSALPFIESALDIVRGELFLRGAAVIAADGETPEPLCVRAAEGSTGLSVSATILKRVLENGEAVLCGDAAADERFAGAESVIMSRNRAVVCAPIHALGRVRGVIYGSSSESAGTYGEKDLAFLTCIAALVGAALRIEEETVSRA